MKIEREYTRKQVEAKVKFHMSKPGVTDVGIHNPIVRVGKFRVRQKITWKGKNYKIHSFSHYPDECYKALLQLLTKKGEIDCRARTGNTYVTIDNLLISNP